MSRLNESLNHSFSLYQHMILLVVFGIIVSFFKCSVHVQSKAMQASKQHAHSVYRWDNSIDFCFNLSTYYFGCTFTEEKKTYKTM